MLGKSLSKPSGIAALACAGVSKSYPVSDEGSSWRIIFGVKNIQGKVISALKNISLSVAKGEICGVLGRNGAGKSTLLRTLGGVYLPDIGEININGDLSGLFELGGVGNRHLTGREYSVRSLMFQGVKVKNVSFILDEIQDFSELDFYFDLPIYTYSTGMAARLYFATATAIPHDVYLIDEILSVGDEHFQGKCWRRMRNLLSKGASGILVTHDWSAVIKLCRESHIMDSGEIAFSGPSDVTVAKYLNLKAPDSKVACFTDQLPSTFTRESGQDSEFLFEIEVLENVPVMFGYSIELLRLGVGWEILIMSDPQFVTQKAGRSVVHLFIPNLPLTQGEYSFNLFLTSTKGEVYDVKSWTYGNTLKLIVNGGATTEAIAAFPLHWEQVHE